MNILVANEALLYNAGLSPNAIQLEESLSKFLLLISLTFILTNSLFLFIIGQIMLSVSVKKNLKWDLTTTDSWWVSDEAVESSATTVETEAAP